MVKCPNCEKGAKAPEKTWAYGPFEVKAYLCACGMKFREYAKDGKHSFTLKRVKGKGYVKA